MYAKTLKRKPLIRWILLFGMLIAIPITLYVAFWTRNALLEQLHQRAADDLKVNIAYMQSRIDTLFTMTQIVGTDERVLDLLQQRNDYKKITRVNHFLARFNVAAHTIAYILDTDGVVIASSNWAAPDSFVGNNYSFRPYFINSIGGHASQYVAIGVTSGRLGYYVSWPIRIDDRVVAVAVTKTNPQDLVLASERRESLFFITDSNGVAIISNPALLQYYSLAPLSKSVIERLDSRRQYTGVNIKSLSNTPIETIGNVRVLSVSANAALDTRMAQQRYVLTTSAVPAAGWTAHILWPIHNLPVRIMESLLLTMFALVAVLLMVIFTVDRWRHMKQMHLQAIRDPLTGLYTRLYMLESATALLAAHDRDNVSGVGAIMFDLDHFKRINDQYGHSAGDNVLVKVSEILLKACRESDIPIRYGGEELLLFISSVDEGQLLQLAERIRLKIEKLDVFLAGHRTTITISGGFALHHAGESLEKLIDRADRLMYQAKQRGRNQICWKPASRALGETPPVASTMGGGW